MSVGVFHAVTNESFCYIDTNLNKHNACLIIGHFKLERFQGRQLRPGMLKNARLLINTRMQTQIERDMQQREGNRYHLYFDYTFRRHHFIEKST